MQHALADAPGFVSNRRTARTRKSANNSYVPFHHPADVTCRMMNRGRDKNSSQSIALAAVEDLRSPTWQRMADRAMVETWRRYLCPRRMPS